ncbi:Uncharacterized protein BP5553_09953 [Venustampulla echinocandica]|uniref:Uncharacterized protein n=1 Tax=Venustampulla echinocandica TaxID=2656787 RepID=A0A370TB63_9HELO|nr:Uncharacterized protein BP5553_09953 [Venustampulla echinocandica]RDL31164.1 Uncharacterized protein BP5553_09953 [Venustampulla echinocandica]
MSLFTAQVRPGQALGFLVLGATLHDILTRLKAEPQRFPKLDLVYELTSPVKEPVILSLPTNGIRLRFDGPEQRLRLIEVLDFTKSHLTYNDRDVLRPVTTAQASSATSPIPSQSGPTYRHIYKNLLGPTFPGEYIQPDADDDTAAALYVLSYPGLAFSFPIESSLWSTGKDAVSLLSSSTSPPAGSMAIFSGDSWVDARERLFTQTIDPSDKFGAILKGKDSVPAEVRLVKIYGGGRLELVRSRNHNPFWIKLGHTSPQELVAELGPPDAIYRKSDQRMSIHKARQGAGVNRLDPNDIRLHDDSTDTDQSSAHTATDDSDDDNGEGEVAGNVSGECFYNYFYHGIDVLMSTPTTPSQCPPSQDSTTQDGNPEVIVLTDASTCLVASKLILHGNVPGSYPFNRHCRCRWEIQYLSHTSGEDVVNSETPFMDIESRLHEDWKSIYKNAEEAKARQRGMVLNRDWGDSPGSSCELLGGWEDSVGGGRLDAIGAGIEDVKGLGNTTLFGFPGLVFEVLKNGVVSSVTVF